MQNNDLVAKLLVAEFPQGKAQEPLINLIFNLRHANC